MAEQVKKKPVDPNSAKYKLGKIAADAYVDAMEAKKRGEKVAWVSSNFPVEIPETMGIATVYPENQAAGIAAAAPVPACARRLSPRAIPTISAPTRVCRWPMPS